MASYVVMEPPTHESDGAVLVRDGFHWLAFLVPVIWLPANRLWLEALAFVGAAIVLGALGSFAGWNNVVTVASLMLALLIGLEASTLKIASLRRRGWREWGVVEADGAREAEIRYLSEVSGTDATVEPDATLQPVPSHYPWPAQVAGPALGLLDYPGRA